MRTLSRLVGAVVLAAACAAVGCAKSEQIIGLAHVINDDGPDKSSPAGQNPGTQTLTLVIAFIGSQGSQPGIVPVGQQGQLFAEYAGQSVGLGGVTLVSSDSTVVNFISSGPWQLNTFSAGNVTISGTFQGAKASASMTVVPNANGVSAIMIPNSDLGQWSPSAVTVAAGSKVELDVGQFHNVVFTPIAGVPANIASGATSDNVRTFAAAGTFAFQCTVHGESGTVVVRP
jgi:plastocyanin